MHNTEDKRWWCQLGEELESRFVDICNMKLGLKAEINPEKERNPYVPDLIVDGKLSDLKVQNTPFFVSTRYHMEPRYTVTFNRKDYRRYSKLYPDLDIYFWIDWKQTEWKDRKVEYLAGIYYIPFQDIRAMIKTEEVPEHTYMNRRDDCSGNAKSSFLLDIRRFKVLFQKEEEVTSDSTGCPDQSGSVQV